MKNNRTFAQEAKAMEFTIKSLYSEREYLEKRIDRGEGNGKTTIQLQMVNHFIEIYEGY